MKRSVSLLLPAFLLSLIPPAHGEDHPSEEDVFEYHVGEDHGGGAGGYFFPELFLIGTGGVFEPGSGASDFATTEHDPQNDATVQALELFLNFEFNEKITGAVVGFSHLGEDRVWEAELHEAYLHYHVNDNIAIGGGEFLNGFGFQTSRHVHAWDFVNQNLPNSRLLNEGEFVTRGGEGIFEFDSLGTLTIGGGTARTHAHAHEQEEEHEEEPHHLEADEAGFNDWVASLDYRFRLPADDSMTISTSFAAGENGFGRDTYAYGAGIQKIWNAHDHGQGPEFCTGALLIRSEFIGREVEARTEDGDALEFDDCGFSTGLHYGLSDRTTLSLRYDWISEVEAAELAEAHRISPALTAYLDEKRNIHARVQYDYIRSDDYEGEHAAWFQVQILLGNGGAGHHGHAH